MEPFTVGTREPETLMERSLVILRSFDDRKDFQRFR